MKKEVKSESKLPGDPGILIGLLTEALSLPAPFKIERHIQISGKTYGVKLYSAAFDAVNIYLRENKK